MAMQQNERHIIKEVKAEEFPKLFGASVFQSQEMAKLYSLSDSNTPFCLAIYDHNEVLVGGLLSVIVNEKRKLPRFLSSRCIIYGGPIILNNCDRTTVLDLLLKSLVKAVKRQTIFIQFRNFFAWSDSEKDVFIKNGFKFQERLNQITNCSDLTKMWGIISRSKRNQINKSIKNGAAISDMHSEDELEQFYRILSDLYREKVQKPIPTYSYFREAFEMSKNSNSFIFRVIKFKNRVIGGIFCPITSGSTIFEYYVCGLDVEYQRLGIFPSVLATWSAMEYANKNNIPEFDFMGLGHPERDYGVREFKMKFGGEIINNGRFERINKPFLFFFVELGYNFLAFLKRI